MSYQYNDGTEISEMISLPEETWRNLSGKERHRIIEHNKRAAENIANKKRKQYYKDAVEWGSMTPKEAMIGEMTDSVEDFGKSIVDILTDVTIGLGKVAFLGIKQKLFKK